MFGSALGIGFSGSAVLRVKFTGERKPEVRRAVKMVALLLGLAWPSLWSSWPSGS